MADYIVHVGVSFPFLQGFTATPESSAIAEAQALMAALAELNSAKAIGILPLRGDHWTAELLDVHRRYVDSSHPSASRG